MLNPRPTKISQTGSSSQVSQYQCPFILPLTNQHLPHRMLRTTVEIWTRFSTRPIQAIEYWASTVGAELKEWLVIQMTKKGKKSNLGQGNNLSKGLRWESTSNSVWPDCRSIWEKRGKGGWIGRQEPNRKRPGKPYKGVQALSHRQWETTEEVKHGGNRVIFVYFIKTNILLSV